MNSNSILVIGAWVFAFAYVAWETHKRDVRLLGRSLQGENESVLQAIREWFKALGFLAASIAAIFAFWQFTLANHRFQVDQRPWLSMTPAMLADVQLGSTGLTWRLDFSLKNSGLTPALHAAVSQQAMFGAFTPETEKAETCANAESSNSTRTIFPRDELPWSSTGILSNAKIEAYRAMLTGSRAAAFIAPLVLVCIAYKSTLDSEFHHTVYALVLTLDEGVTIDTPRDKQIDLHGFVRELPFDRIGSAD
ncbi:hypothetical protein NLM31_22840 [Bradyrhizobium sp. CCGUVB4N]|uniref:hypothetical protein n=1 Tax=Bradyrhizobium sp. CCGUVB4N TaxID=2949631 RepID=UPI0020B37C98|nr:hypothetical protein [Bradyrhizobium sp. CCGUVB4N]MCP3383208.1 hypothetical protein [Bradyrhizobium sp. CCGUVB4N]